MSSKKTQMRCFGLSAPSGRLIPVLIVAIVLCLESCKSKMEAVREVEKTTVETVTEILRDTTIAVKDDHALIRALLECDSIGQVHIKKLLDYRGGDRLKPPGITIADNVLTAISHADSILIYLTLKERFSKKQTENKITEYVYENRLTRWQEVRLWIANILLIILPVSGILYFHHQFFKKQLS